MANININLSGGERPSIKSKRFWIKTLIMAISILITCFLFSIAEIGSVLDAVIAAVVISLLNAFVRPLLQMISLPFIMFSFGFFLLFINAFIIMLAASLLPGFNVGGFMDAVLFSIIISIISFFLDLPLRLRESRKKMEEVFNQRQGQEMNNSQIKEEETFTDYEDLTDKDDKK